MEQKQNQVCPPLPHMEPGSTARVGSAEGVQSCGLGWWVGRGLGLGQRGAVCPGALYLGPRMALVAVRVNSDQPGAQAGASQLGVVWRQSCEQHPLVLVATGSLRPRHQGRKSPPWEMWKRLRLG